MKNLILIALVLIGLSASAATTLVTDNIGAHPDASAAGYPGTITSTFIGNGSGLTNLSFTSLTNNLTLRTNFTATGSITATNGYVSFNRNTLPLSAITPSGSPFAFTNTFVTNSITVFVGGGTVTQIAINDTSTDLIAASLELQPGEWVITTYSVAPTMKWKAR